MCSGKRAVPIAGVIFTFIALVCWCVNETGAARLKQKIPGVVVTVPCTMKAYQTQQKTTRRP